MDDIKNFELSDETMDFINGGYIAPADQARIQGFVNGLYNANKNNPKFCDRIRKVCVTISLKDEMTSYDEFVEEFERLINSK